MENNLYLSGICTGPFAFARLLAFLLWLIAFLLWRFHNRRHWSDEFTSDEFK
jgi:hypothetical protein